MSVSTKILLVCIFVVSASSYADAGILSKWKSIRTGSVQKKVSRDRATLLLQLQQAKRFHRIGNVMAKASLSFPQYPDLPKRVSFYQGAKQRKYAEAMRTMSKLKRHMATLSRLQSPR